MNNVLYEIFVFEKRWKSAKLKFLKNIMQCQKIN